MPTKRPCPRIKTHVDGSPWLYASGYACGTRLLVDASTLFHVCLMPRCLMRPISGKRLRRVHAGLAFRLLLGGMLRVSCRRPSGTWHRNARGCGTHILRPPAPPLRPVQAGRALACRRAASKERPLPFRSARVTLFGWQLKCAPTSASVVSWQCCSMLRSMATRSKAPL